MNAQPTIDSRVPLSIERPDNLAWIYVGYDRDEDGKMHLLNATGIYPSEITAGLASETYVREWKAKMSEADPTPETIVLPIWIEEPHGGT